MSISHPRCKVTVQQHGCIKFCNGSGLQFVQITVKRTICLPLAFVSSLNFKKENTDNAKRDPANTMIVNHTIIPVAYLNYLSLV